MKANPGGQIDPSEVMGRDSLIQDLWRALERQSVVLTAERRIGKTSVIKKMVEEASDGCLPIYHDLEGIRSPIEFVEVLFHDVEGYLGRFKRTAERVRLLLGHLEGAELGGLVKFPTLAAPHWKSLLVKTVEDLMEHSTGNVIFFWDEAPLMIYNISRVETGGHAVAAELLDTLRALRQTHPAFRMVFTGSIGFPNVLAQLRDRGYANDPTNDMRRVDVPALLQEDGAELARRLLEGEGLAHLAGGEIPALIANALDSLPYYIHHFVDRLATDRPERLTEPIIDSRVETCLIDPQDPWDLAHYRNRIDTYYPPDDQPLALAVLDILATADSLCQSDIFERVKAKVATEDAERVRTMVTLLQRDHYLAMSPTGQIAYRFPLIRRYWLRNRGSSR